MKRLGRLAALSVLPLAAALGGAPATAATTVHVAGVVRVAGSPVGGALVTLGASTVATEVDGAYAAEVPTGTTALTLEVTTPHAVRDTSVAYHGTLSLTADQTLNLSVPGDRATTLAVTEADGLTPVARAEYDLFHGPGVKLVPELGPFDHVTGIEHGADDAVTDDAGRAIFYVPDLATGDTQTATVTAYDPRYTRPSVSATIAYPRTPPTVALRFPVAAAPSAPRGLVTEVVAEESVALAWSPPQSDGGSVVTDYVVTYGGTGEAPTVRVVAPSGGSGERVRLTGLTPGRQYDVAVVARNAVGTSTAARLQVTTRRVPVTVALTSWSPTAPVSGQAVTLAGTVSSWTGYPVRGGTVTVYDGGVALATLPLTDGAFALTRTFLAGGHAIAVAYSGDAVHLAATPSTTGSPPPTFTVARAASRLAVTSTISGKGKNRDVRLDVVAASSAPGAGTPTGTVSVTVSTGGSVTASLSGGAASVTFANLRAKQTVTVTVSYAGSAEHAPSSTTYTLVL